MANRPTVEIRPSTQPRTKAIPPSANWVDVKIKLSDEQIEELAKAGVNITELKITTCDISSIDEVAN